jgi:hypothetical protein
VVVSSKEDLTFKELVLVDAQTGFIALHFNQIDSARNRFIYDNANNPSAGLPGTGPVRTEGQGATGISDVDNAYDFSGDTYDFFYDEHSRDSLDDAGMAIVSTVRYCPNASSCPYANAFWNGVQLVFGDGYASADDVVGHELTHGVTDFSSHLFYYYQSGAMNESFSDIWGEFVDLENGRGTDTPAVRWKMGEDIPGGAIRDMSNPPAYGDPDYIGSPYYYCEELDQGGVHTNSGVNNKAAYLMTDGGSFRGKSVTALGISKVADLYYEAQTNLLTSGSNYRDLYNALIQASMVLGFSSAEQQSVQNALDAVAMDQRPCGDSAEAPLCTGEMQPVNLFYDDLENTSSGNWVTGAIQGSNHWAYPQNPNTFPYYNLDATYTSSGVYNFYAYDTSSTADYFIAMTLDIEIATGTYLHFHHDWNFEGSTSFAWDGGVLDYSINGGVSWQELPGTMFTHNGYSGTLRTGNPLAPRQAFAGESHGYTASRVDLDNLDGESARFRFRIGTDSILDDWGWFIDDVRIYHCGIPGYLPLVTK